VAHIRYGGFFIYAPDEHAEHRCRRVLPVACPGFLSFADIKGPPRRSGATRDSANRYLNSETRHDWKPQSFPRKRESTPQAFGDALPTNWIPASAGMTGVG